MQAILNSFGTPRNVSYKPNHKTTGVSTTEPNLVLNSYVSNSVVLKNMENRPDPELGDTLLHDCKCREIKDMDHDSKFTYSDSSSGSGSDVRSDVGRRATRRSTLLVLVVGFVCLLVGLLCLVVAAPNIFGKKASCSKGEKQPQSLRIVQQMNSTLAPPPSTRDPDLVEVFRGSLLYIRDNYNPNITAGYGPNLALRRPVRTSTKARSHANLAGYLATDGDSSSSTRENKCAQTEPERSPYLMIDIGRLTLIRRVVIIQPTDCCAGELRDFEVRIGQSLNAEDNALCKHHMGAAVQKMTDVECNRLSYGRYVSVQLVSRHTDNVDKTLTLCEIMVHSR